MSQCPSNSVWTAGHVATPPLRPLHSAPLLPPLLQTPWGLSVSAFYHLRNQAVILLNYIAQSRSAFKWHLTSSGYLINIFLLQTQWFGCSSRCKYYHLLIFWRYKHTDQLSDNSMISKRCVLLNREFLWPQKLYRDLSFITKSMVCVFLRRYGSVRLAVHRRTVLLHAWH